MPEEEQLRRNSIPILWKNCRDFHWMSLCRMNHLAVLPHAKRYALNHKRWNAPGLGILRAGIIIQIGPKPSLDLRQAHSLAFAIVDDLIPVDLAKREIS